MSVSSLAKTKKLLLTSQLKRLDKCVQEADRMLSESVPADDKQCDATSASVGEFTCRFTETIKKTETLFEELAPLVYEFVATKTAEKDLKRKEEEFLEDTVETITECNDKVALLNAKRLSLKRSSSSSGQDKRNITPNVQIDTSGLENSMLKLTTTTEKNTESLLTQLAMNNHSGSNTMDSIRLPKL